MPRTLPIMSPYLFFFLRMSSIASSRSRVAIAVVTINSLLLTISVVPHPYDNRRLTFILKPR